MYTSCLYLCMFYPINVKTADPNGHKACYVNSNYPREGLKMAEDENCALRKLQIFIIFNAKY